MTTLGIEQRKLEERILRLPRLQIYSSTLIKDFYLLPAAVAVKEVVQVVILFLFQFRLTNFRAYFPSSSSICRYVSQKPWQERLGIGQSQSDLSTMIGKTILCVSSSTLLPLLHCHFQSYFLKTPQKMTLAVVTKYLISRGQKHESLSSKSAFSTFFKRVERP